MDPALHKPEAPVSLPVMKKNLFVPLALVIGISGGYFVGQANKPARPETIARTSSPTQDTSTNVRTRPASRTPAPGTSKSGKPASTPKSLAALMELISANWNAAESITFLQAVEALGVEQIAAMMSDLSALDPNDPRRYRLCNAISNRWAALDPDGAWNAVIQLKDKNLSRSMMMTVIGSIAQSDLGKARRLLAEIKDPQMKQSALYGLINQAASEDPEEAFRLLASEPVGHRGYGHYQSLFQKWAKDDPETAIAKLSEIKGTSNRQQALQGIAAALVTSDPQRALALANEQPPGEGRNGLLASICSTWFSSDSDAAVAWIQSLPATERSKVLENGSWQMIQQNPAKAAELFATLPLNTRTAHNFSNLASTWAQQDLAAARAWAESLPPGSARAQALNGIIGTVAQSDPVKAAGILGDTVINNQNYSQVATIAGEWIKTDQKAALAWLDGLDLRGNTRQNVHSQFMSQWVREDAPAAGRYALGIQDEKVRQQAISSLVGGWAHHDPAAAHDWIMASLEGESKDRSFKSLIQNLSYQDPTTAFRFYQEATANLTPDAIEKTFGDTASQMVGSLVRDDPKAASQWVMGMPEGETRSNSIRRMVDDWGDNDIQGAAAFVDTLGAGKDRDLAVASLVDDLRQQDDFESAFDWAATVGEASKRESLIRNAANHWQQDDPAAARAAVSRANISDKAKASILESLKD